MITNIRDITDELTLTAARTLLGAVKTAPHAKGVDILEAAVISGDELAALVAHMKTMGQAPGRAFFIRDASNIEQSPCVMLVGTHLKNQGLNCEHCGFATCGEKPDLYPCALNALDVGIALGSAASRAADMRIDSRIMFSAGLAAQELGFLGENVHLVFALPLSITAKSPYFDRG